MEITNEIRVTHYQGENRMYLTVSLSDSKDAKRLEEYLQATADFIIKEFFPKEGETKGTMIEEFEAMKKNKSLTGYVNRI